MNTPPVRIGNTECTRESQLDAARGGTISDEALNHLSIGRSDQVRQRKGRYRDDSSSGVLTGPDGDPHRRSWKTRSTLLGCRAPGRCGSPASSTTRSCISAPTNPNRRSLFSSRAAMALRECMAHDAVLLADQRRTTGCRAKSCSIWKRVLKRIDYDLAHASGRD